MRNFVPEKAERLDQYVIRQLPALSRSYASQLVEDGQVSVNDKPQVKPGYKVRTGDQIVITYEEATEQIIPKIEIPVLYEDDDCVVINKPIGLLTHSKGAFNPEATVASWLADKIVPGTFRADASSEADETDIEAEAIPYERDAEPEKYNPMNDRDGIVHRLDRATSGVMICAKTPEALSWLQKQFSQRKVKKSYVAITTGIFPNEQAIIDMPIERNPKKPQTFRVGSNGKSAVTAYTVIEASDTLSMLELTPTTGRTHQLRVHLVHLGHPIVGDTMYGGKLAERLYLHAKTLEITLPNRERKVFNVPVPDEFKELMAS